MTVKLLALYKKPDDIKEFDEHYFNTHVPLTEKMPGLLKAEYQKITGSPIGKTDYHLLAELTFESMEALQAAMGSEAGKAAAKDLMGFAGNLVTLMFAQPAEACSPVEV
jgi:uncharacterized protein (TIGR02118 family)